MVRHRHTGAARGRTGRFRRLTPACVGFHEGTHVPDATLPSRVRHERPFTASEPFCSTGFAADTENVSDQLPLGLVVLRKFTCGDGSGSFTAQLAVTAEHATSGSGRWEIVDGTGKYVTLWGMGTMPARA